MRCWTLFILIAVFALGAQLPAAAHEPSSSEAADLQEILDQTAMQGSQRFEAAAQALPSNAPFTGLRELGYNGAAESGNSIAQEALLAANSGMRVTRPQTVFAPDQRVHVDPAVSTVALILGVLDWGFGSRGTFDGDETGVSCTATFIGPRALATVGHCLYTIRDPDEVSVGSSAGAWPIDVLVVPGWNGGGFPFGYAWASHLYVHGEWAWMLDNWWQAPSSLEEFLRRDLGLIILPDNLGDVVGWEALGVLPTSALSAPGFGALTVGYPGDKPAGTQWAGAQAPVTQVTDDYLYFNQLDVFSGQSGSGIFRVSSEPVAMVSIVSWGDERYNATVRTTLDTVGFYASSCAEQGCQIAAVIEEDAPPPPPPPPTPPPPPPPAPGTPDLNAFYRTWERTDRPVRDGAISRTWMWGPQAFTGHMQEPYAEGVNGQRTVLYHDKSRMEITNPSGDPNSIWYVSNGLLVTELVTGRVQLGNNAFEQHAPAQINVAGDADDASGPTYATFGALLGAVPMPVGTTITQAVDRASAVRTDTSLAGYDVTAAVHVPETNHTVASVFWDFMNSQGLVYENGGLQTAALFQNAFYATGFPISEPYWATVKVGGTYKVVLVQIFERRVLTYTPGNSAGWQVEAGNVGRHYFHWRYEVIPG